MHASALHGNREREERPARTAVPIPVAANLGFSAAAVAVCLLQFFVLPVALLPFDAAWGWLLVPIVLATTTYWSIVHEAIHGRLLPGRRANGILGRILCIFFGAPFQMLRFFHLSHHRFNRSALDRPDISSREPRPSAGEYLGHYFMTCAGLYLVEAWGTLVPLLPKPLYERALRRLYRKRTDGGLTRLPAARRQLIEEPGLTRLRLDGLCIVALFGMSFWLYGVYWWMLLLSVLGRAFLISLADMAYHYGNRPDELNAGYNLRLPRWIEFAFLNFNLHEVHHRHPDLPWPGLRTRFVEERDRYHAGYLYASFRQLAGPLPEGEARDGRYDVRLTGRL